jgi:hypothetical protein
VLCPQAYCGRGASLHVGSIQRIPLDVFKLDWCAYHVIVCRNIACFIACNFENSLRVYEE